MIVTAWGLWNQNLSHGNILRESLVVTAAWKWRGDPKVYHVAINPAKPRSDRQVVKGLHRAILEADIVVAHNGDKFDIRKFNARAIYHKLAPLPKKHTIDTLKVAKKYFYFNSNRLDYLGKFLLGERKIKTSYDLWLEVMDGNVEAITKMVKYNKRDVVLLEKVYDRLAPYMQTGPNFAIFAEAHVCSRCGSKRVKHSKWKYQLTTKRMQYLCLDCGGYSCGALVAKVGIKP